MQVLTIFRVYKYVCLILSREKNEYHVCISKCLRGNGTGTIREGIEQVLFQTYLDKFNNVNNRDGYMDPKLIKEV